MYIDTHAHLYSDDFETDIESVLNECRESGVGKIILPDIDKESRCALEKLYINHKDTFYATVGLHPTSVNDNLLYKEDLQTVEELLDRRKIDYIAIGECGLDLYWSKKFFTEQSEALIFQIKLSQKFNLPLILHCRDAWNEMVEILADFKGVKGVFHGFSGTLEHYNKGLDLGGFKFGIGGVVTFKNSGLSDVVKYMDLSDIVLETDSPYLTPVPYRGKRNDPKFITIIASRIAEIKSVSIENVAQITTQNSIELFSL